MNFSAHSLSGNQQQLNFILFPKINKILYGSKRLYFKRNILFLIQIIHEIKGIIHLQITHRKNVFLQYTPPTYSMTLIKTGIVKWKFSRTIPVL